MTHGTSLSLPLRKGELVALIVTAVVDVDSMHTSNTCRTQARAVQARSLASGRFVTVEGAAAKGFFVTSKVTMPHLCAALLHTTLAALGSR